MPTRAQDSRRELARAILGRDAWFAHFSEEALDSFVNRSELFDFRPEEMFSRSGDRVKFLGVVIEGTLHASRTGVSGKRHIVGYFGPVQVVNLIPILDDQRGLHDIAAHSDTTVLAIPKEAFIAALEHDPTAARQTMRLLCLRSRSLYENASNSALLPLRARCARMLLSLMASHGLTRQSGVDITLKLTQDEFADMLGRTRQNVNRELKQFERDGVIEMRYSHFIVRGERALRDIIEGEGLEWPPP